jgi:DNA phosphorothioation-dependent restriction protein DptH
MKLTDETREKIIAMLQKGKSSSEIAEEIGISKMQVAGIKAHITIKKDITHVVQLDSKKEDIPSLWKKTQPPKDLSNETAKTSILIGTDQVFNKKVYWNFNPETGSVNPHVLIVGETGFGKTYATQCVVAELKKKGIATIIFDYGQGFGLEEASKKFIEITKPVQIEASKNGVAINPLQIFPDDMMGPVNVAQRTADTFCRIYPKMGIQQKEAIVEAVSDVFFFADIHPDDKNSWKRPLPQFDEIHTRLRSIADSDEHALRNYAKTSYSHISSFFRFNVIRDDGEKLTWDKMIYRKGSVWIIQLKGLDHYVSMIVTEMLLWNLINFLQSEGPGNIRLFVVLDEAHKLSFDRGTPVEWILREGRKFGAGVILSSQQLEDYSKVAISNTATKLIFQNHDDKYALSKALEKKCKNISDYRKISEIITTLERGKTFGVNENVGRIIAIDKIEERGLQSD